MPPPTMCGRVKVFSMCPSFLFSNNFAFVLINLLYTCNCMSCQTSITTIHPIFCCHTVLLLKSSLVNLILSWCSFFLVSNFLSVSPVYFPHLHGISYTTKEFFSFNGVFALVLRSFTFLTVLFATQKPCCLATQKPCCLTTLVNSRHDLYLHTNQGISHFHE